jgi:hypothetical protein
MVKEPRPGRVKTRLGREIGMVAAAGWMRRQTLRMIRTLADPRWRLILAVAPDAALRSRVWPVGPARRPQGRGDLGERMGRIFRDLPPGPVVIVGADIPGITRGHVARAFARLGAAEAVIGPAPDGGYWLIGLHRTAKAPAGLFGGVRWSTATARADTLATLAGRRVALTDTLADVDTAADLAAFPR